jgi:hypothetical protein
VEIKKDSEQRIDVHNYIGMTRNKDDLIDGGTRNEIEKVGT